MQASEMDPGISKQGDLVDRFETTSSARSVDWPRSNRRILLSCTAQITGCVLVMEGLIKHNIFEAIGGAISYLSGYSLIAAGPCYTESQLPTTPVIQEKAL